MTKQAEEHRLPLSDEAVALLASIRETAPAKARYVFPGATPFKPRHSIRHAWDRIREAAGLGDMRIHDLRHSHARFLVNAGFRCRSSAACSGTRRQAPLHAMRTCPMRRCERRRRVWAA